MLQVRKLVLIPFLQYLKTDEWRKAEINKKDKIFLYHVHKVKHVQCNMRYDFKNSFIIYSNEV